MTTTDGQPFEATERLAKRVLGGSVVFFIGAGFSIDSEGNTADRLIARLFARLLAIATCLANELPDPRSEPRRLLESLSTVFGLQDSRLTPGDAPQPARCMTAANVKLLAREYYNFNEWSVSAFGVLWREMHQLDDVRRAAVGAAAHDLENFLLTSLGTDGVPLDPVEWTQYHFARDADRGKALFLDTMGFANPEIMRGNLQCTDIEQLVDSFRGRLRARHHTLARLAREGLIPFLVTTNYDLLIEGAYRLAGFFDREDALTAHDDLPVTSIPSYSRIAGADQFLTRGDSYRTALLLKIHGCVENYRTARDNSLGACDLRKPSWESYLPAMVFTYREIQTWRADAWSRDLIRTLLRAHTLALCGYSGADPVMHSTFREVYEEMAQLRRGRGSEPTGGKSAPVFFFDVAEKREFYSLEILRAASHAAGDPVDGIGDHPNRIEFNISAGGFPTLDDHARWLTHNLLRDIQAQALDARLRRLMARFLGHPCPDRDLDTVRAAFTALREAERVQMNQRATSPDARRTFESTVGWTWHFLPGLLRELALAELVETQRGPGRSVHTLRRWPWYFPATERPEWTAWATVVELAVRNMVMACRSGGSDVSGQAPPGLVDWISAEDSPHAVVSFMVPTRTCQAFALCIRLGGFDRPGRPPALNGVFRRITTWELREEDVPWRSRRYRQCPAAVTLWNAALGQLPSPKRIAFFLGAHE